jgi:hypothetical protein
MEVLSYSCISCNKNYGTYKNLWAHNKSHHNGIKTVKVAFIQEDDKSVTFKCRKCNNVYKHYSQGIRMRKVVEALFIQR